MGKELSMFVTFWGFDAIKKSDIKTTGRPFLEKIVPWMRHKWLLKLGTSKNEFRRHRFSLLLLHHGQEKRRTPFVPYRNGTGSGQPLDIRV
jgi:peroxiredoxin family protein